MSSKNKSENNQEPRFARTRFRQASELLASILPITEPADTLMDRYFKAHREMGSQDRGFAAETVYGCLRRLRELRALSAGTGPFVGLRFEAETLVATYLITVLGWSGRALEDTDFKDRSTALIKAVRSFDKSSLSFADRLNLPDWLAEPIRQQLGDDEAEKLARALNEPAPVDLRVSTRRISRDDVQKRLTEQSFDCSPMPLSPWGLRRAQRGPLFNTKEFKDGLFEMQDEASQLVGWLVSPRPRQTVIDFCAGAGGKTLHLAELMNNKGNLVACDVAAYRLDKMKPRLIRAQLDNVRLLPLSSENDDALKGYYGEADAVLVDAPCSGSGTLRRNPDMKWRVMDIASLHDQQLSILTGAAHLVKPGGRLVYATCSLLAQENQAVVEAFLATHPDFVRVGIDGSDHQDEGILAAFDALDPILAANLRERGELVLLPHKHHTDGFFGQRLQRRL
ncbi:RsmB/NOP family class I SAM-dependent RNA methyltransferase [Permianibacter sp. IMCC34836]|uniref:RsmB/NOP family class I SAM-dependent RNA methyltransferase n=1 Tax=Permianibacter fluminis TaxID=2738515 RepID=UPI0015529A49|nr:RsmB/NOP family class I SAM-dependent RNA methyltransferase [Permianibacter fluminis]NQD36418.1 RsmB/NOP family class I SAM-dependent RNA methyltransferase [Permianibacter fluminis]